MHPPALPSLLLLLLLAATTAHSSTLSLSLSPSLSPSHARILRTPSPHGPGSSCTVLPSPSGDNDSPTLSHALSATSDCKHIVFPANSTYSIQTRIHATVEDVTIDWRGRWVMSTANLTYWRQNAFPIAFQNHAAGIVFSGSGIRINGYGTGGVDGGGDVWYTQEKGSTRVGRPMPFVMWNVSDVEVRRFSVWQPPLWAFNIMNGTNLYFEDLYSNATAFSAPAGTNWVQNTDGFDTMDVRNLTLRGFVYQGGDDCIAIKPRSYDIDISNVTCRGGNGIAIGSLGQYLEDSSVENTTIRNVHLLRYNEDLHNSAYIKTWVGIPTAQSSYESAGQPNGGGWGVVRNITFADFWLQGADSGPAINQDSGNNGTATKGTSKMLVSDITYRNFTGYVTKGKNTATVSCSRVNLCEGIVFEGIELLQGVGGAPNAGAESCSLIAPGGVTGLNSSSCNV